MHSSYVITDPEGTVLQLRYAIKGSPMTDENGKIKSVTRGKKLYTNRIKSKV